MTHTSELMAGGTCPGDGLLKQQRITSVPTASPRPGGGLYGPAGPRFCHFNCRVLRLRGNRAQETAL
jgi:hypothetical protein